MKYAADFETTTDPTDCRVWAFGVSSVEDPDMITLGNSIDGFMEWLESVGNTSVYFHNLKFDGEFIISWLFEHGWGYVEDKHFLREKTFTTLINDSGAFYSMEICFSVKYKKRVSAKIYDSLKLLPFSVDQVAKSFNLPISKLSIDYDEYREPGHELTEEEEQYLIHDIKIVAMALHTLFDEGLTAMTAGSNALKDFKAIVQASNFSKWYPLLDQDKELRQCYKGGWTYCNPVFQGKNIEEGIVLDVNSLYPSRMYDCYLPYGEPIWYEGQYQEDKLYPLYIQMIQCSFMIKKDHLPSIGLRNLRFLPTDYVRDSGPEPITLCLTSVDLELMFEQYDVYNLEYLSGWKFKASNMVFRPYIDKWIKIKNEATIEGNAGMRTLAKLMLNSLYGKFALNPVVRRKHPILDNGKVRYVKGQKEERDPIYLPVGAFITAHARYLTITSAQKVYHRFLYADTDSLHLIGTEIPEGLEVDPVKLGAWKHESTFDRARFLRAKCYIEEINGKLNVACAGMPANCHEQVTWDNFKLGASYSGKLVPKHVPGGIVLCDTDFTIRA